MATLEQRSIGSVDWVKTIEPTRPKPLPCRHFSQICQHIHSVATWHIEENRGRSNGTVFGTVGFLNSRRKCRALFVSFSSREAEDVFLFEGGVWKDEKTDKAFEPGTLVQGTRGLFRLERTEEGTGKIVLITGGGVIGEGKLILWSDDGNGHSGKIDRHQCFGRRSIPRGVGRRLAFLTVKKSWTRLPKRSGSP